MTTETDVLRFIANGEGSRIEFKERFDENLPEEIAHEIVGFANMHGGYILVGVSDVGETIGLRDREARNRKSWIMDTVIGRHVHPMIVPEYDEIVIDGKKIAVISIPMGTAKPYAVRENNREDFYIRVDDVCRLASREQLRRLFESGGILSVERLPVHGSSVEELDERKLRQYFLGLLEYDESRWIEDKIDILLAHSFLNVPEGQRSPCCTYFACALFLYSPRRRLPQAGIRLMVFDGEDMDYNARMDEILDVPFVGLKKDPDVGYHEPSLPDLTMRYLQPHISKDTLDASQSMQRERRWDYPPEAIRELIVNAFAHRDWTRQNEVWVTVYADRMEVKSPGALPNGMTIEKVKAGERTPRNTKILDILRDYGFVEGRGMGIRRKVIPLTVANNGCEPIFEATEDYFKVTLPRGASKR